MNYGIREVASMSAVQPLIPILAIAKIAAKLTIHAGKVSKRESTRQGAWLRRTHDGKVRKGARGALNRPESVFQTNSAHRTATLLPMAGPSSLDKCIFASLTLNLFTLGIRRYRYFIMKRLVSTNSI